MLMKEFLIDKTAGIKSQKVEQYQRIIAICEGLVLLEDQITDLKTLIVKVDSKVSRILNSERQGN